MATLFLAGALLATAVEERQVAVGVAVEAGGGNAGRTPRQADLR